MNNTFVRKCNLCPDKKKDRTIGCKKALNRSNPVILVPLNDWSLIAMMLRVRRTTYTGYHQC